MHCIFYYCGMCYSDEDNSYSDDYFSAPKDSRNSPSNFPVFAMETGDFLHLSLNENNDPEVASVPIATLDISEPTGGYEEGSLETIEVENNDDIWNNNIDNDTYGEEEQYQLIPMEIDDETYCGNIEEGSTNQHQYEQHINNSNFNTSSSTLDNLFTSISNAGQAVFSPTQLGAGLAKHTLLKRLENLETLVGAHDHGGLENIDTPHETVSSIMDYDPIYKHKNQRSGESLGQSRSHSFKNTPLRLTISPNGNEMQTHLIDETSDYENNPNQKGNKSEPPQELTQDTDNGDRTGSVIQGSVPLRYRNSLKEKLVFDTINNTTWGDKPIQLQMHNHYHYHDNRNNPFASNQDSHTNDFSPSFNIQDENYQNNHDDLPSPWSRDNLHRAPAPYLISSYLQLFFNVATMGAVLYIGFSTLRSIRSDITTKLHEKSAEVMMEAAICANNYRKNNCDPDNMAPALERQCFEWKKCMNKSPSTNTYHASVGAEALGIIVNSLVEPIGLKAFVVFLVILCVWVFGSNFVFGFIRAKSYYSQDSQEKQLVLKKDQ